MIMARINKYIIANFCAELSGRLIEPVFMGAILLKLFVERKIKHPEFCLFFIVILMHGLLMTIFTGYDVGKIFQQSFLLFIVLFGYIQLYERQRSIEYWFSVYMKFVYLVAVLGLIQYSAYLIFKINIFPYSLDLFKTQNSARLHSILFEPGSVVSFFMPAVTFIILSIDYFKKNLIKCIIIILAFILTYSSLAFLGIGIALIFKFYNFLKRIKILFYILFGFVVYSLLTINPNVQGVDNDATEYEKAMYKIQETYLTIESLTSENVSPYSFEGLNESTYASLTNYWIAFNAPCRFFGTGIGTHQQNYESLYQSSYYSYGLNEDDAYSLFARILSEFGYLGLIIYLLFVYKRFNKRNILSFCFLNFIICYLIKGGHYTLNGVVLFHFLYYKSYNTVLKIEKI